MEYRNRILWLQEKSGEFDVGMFRDNASREQVKMIEIKLSQGAKPGHGGLLPKQKYHLP